MKKLFAIFCAVVLMPSFSTYAWVGGPFSGNSFFGDSGDDGVYEAVAFPTGGSFANGIGIFRFAVANQSNFTEDAASITLDQTVVPGGVGTAPVVIVSQVVRPAIGSNVYLGGVGQFNHRWFLEGIAYLGNCDGTANSGSGFVTAVGNATEPFSGDDFRISSGWQGQTDLTGNGIPIQRFSGTGNGRTTDQFNPANNVAFTFRVFGSKVSNIVSYNGVIGGVN